MGMKNDGGARVETTVGFPGSTTSGTGSDYSPGKHQEGHQVGLGMQAKVTE